MKKPEKKNPAKKAPKKVMDKKEHSPAAMKGLKSFVKEEAKEKVSKKGK